MPSFRKKPVVIEAEQFWPDKKPWPEGVAPFRTMEAPQYLDENEEPQEKISYILKSFMGEHTVTPGHWIVRDDYEHRWSVAPDEFEKTYEPLSDLQCDLCGGWCKYMEMKTILVTKHDETKVYMTICNECVQLRGADEKKTKALLRDIFVYPMSQRTQRVLNFIGHPNQEKFEWILNSEAKVVGAINELMGWTVEGELVEED